MVMMSAKEASSLWGNQHKESYYALLGRQDSRSKQGKWQLADSCQCRETGRCPCAYRGLQKIRYACTSSPPCRYF